jgi:hypothetical protein
MRGTLYYGSARRGFPDMTNDARSGSWTPWLVGLIVLAMGAALFMAFARRMEPRRITLQHILIAFNGSGTGAARTREAAEKLAQETLARARSGEDFDALMKALSDDPGGGIYTLCNKDVTPGSANEFKREQMVPAFGDVGFKLQAGECGLAPHDPKSSPYGWHLIKRLK